MIRISKKRSGRRAPLQKIRHAAKPPIPVPPPAPVAHEFAGFGRIETINFIIEKRGYRAYLEIGCRDDECFRQIRCAHKVGVDPVSGGTHRMGSDEFFRGCKETFDLIFIDGDHRYPQVLRDIKNASKFIRSDGLIVMHDCFPPTPQHEHESLSGTVWRAFARAREFDNLDAVVLDMPADSVGLGIVVPRQNSAPIVLDRRLDDLSYGDLLLHKHDWMRKMPIEKALRFAGVT